MLTAVGSLVIVVGNPALVGELHIGGPPMLHVNDGGDIGWDDCDGGVTGDIGTLCPLAGGVNFDTGVSDGGGPLG